MIDIGTPSVLLPPTVIEILKRNQIIHPSESNYITLVPAFHCTDVESEVKVLDTFLYEYLEVLEGQCDTVGFKLSQTFMKDYLKKHPQVIKKYRECRESRPEHYVAICFYVWKIDYKNICFGTVMNSFLNDSGVFEFRSFQTMCGKITGAGYGN